MKQKNSNKPGIVFRITNKTLSIVAIISFAVFVVCIFIDRHSLFNSFFPIISLLVAIPFVEIQEKSIIKILFSYLEIKSHYFHAKILPCIGKNIITVLLCFFIVVDFRPILLSIMPSQPIPSELSDNAEFYLTGSIVRKPNMEAQDFILGGIWKLQGIHEDATSFSQAVTVRLADDSLDMYTGYAQYGTVWTTLGDGGWAEDDSDFDDLARYNYPVGTYGTFVVDMESPVLTYGSYECELVIEINKILYTLSIPFEVTSFEN